MKRAHSVIVRACSRVGQYAAALIVGLAVVWIASAPSPAWGQSAWPSYPNNSTISVSSGGNVGIGTTTPLQKLHVANRVVMISGSVPGLVLSDTQTSGRDWSLFSGTPTVGYFKIRDTNAAVDRLVIDTTGRVGIGTSNPQYLLSVNGTIGTKDVIVTNSGWSDYVFQPGYRLQPLSELSAYIQAHRHLPDIPTEAEVTEKGVSVGEMQAKLLAKIEELTLHMIQADERNNRLEQQNRELRDRVVRLETRAAPSGGSVTDR